MENTLVVNGNVEVLDSREVAEMMGKEHKELMRNIKGSGKDKGLIPILESGNYSSSNYFIESTYESGAREYNCYLITKKGCELLGSQLPTSLKA